MSNIPHPAGNGRQQPDPRAYTIDDAEYANAERTAIVVTTREAGALLISQADAPAMWTVVNEAGGIGAYEAPPLSRDPGLVYRRQRERAYLVELAKPEESEINYNRTLGDILDILITQMEVDRLTHGAQRTADYATLLVKIAAIKTLYPKPE